MADANLWQAAATAADAGGGLLTSAFNIHEIRQNRRFQRDMSNTSHQREMEDLKAAGLNPILGAKFGGESTPSGAAPQIENPEVGSKAINTALSLAQLKNIDAQTYKTNTDANDVNLTQKDRLENLIMGWKAQLESTTKTSFETELVQWKIKEAQKALQKLDLDMSHSALDLDRAKRESEFYRSPGGRVMPWMRLVTPAINSAKSLVP